MEIQRCNVWRIWQMNQPPSQVLTVFAWSSKEQVVLHYPDERLWAFCWLTLGTLCRVKVSVGPTGSSTCWNQSFGFSEEAHNRGLPSNSTINTRLPSLNEDHPLMWLVVVHFAWPTISSVQHYCAVSTFITYHNLC